MKYQFVASDRFLDKAPSVMSPSTFLGKHLEMGHIINDQSSAGKEYLKELDDFLLRFHITNIDSRAKSSKAVETWLKPHKWNEANTRFDGLHGLDNNGPNRLRGDFALDETEVFTLTKKYLGAVCVSRHRSPQQLCFPLTYSQTPFVYNLPSTDLPAGLRLARISLRQAVAGRRAHV